ncbi:uncharacterized protein LTR77_008961 [Saxophila tyrrhenica]|uniref:Uncharacterized protein n=1 Tax=Saxophila tyrrhenica TaxID=1690608 RepID=A0AAV9P006_9PEZI|nr:hypothetical protein LTR77_008961 [Saxophila tyrrhenica]
MASPPQSFPLDRSIFNETLYSRLRDFWLAGVPQDATSPPWEAIQRWFGPGMTQEQKDALDRSCHSNFGEALNALGPEKLALPAFESYEDDLGKAEIISSPLLKEVREAHSESVEGGAKRLLSLVVLLDQMPRNIYRDLDGLGLVYGHYDRLSFSLLRSSMKLEPNMMGEDCVKMRPVWLSWLTIPFMHCEHLPSHELYLKYARATRQIFHEKNDTAAVQYLDRNIEFELKHIEPLEKFGRYPHRNAALGRKSTAEEEEYMKSGATFGVTQQKKVEQEDEKKDDPKDEL